MLCNIFGIKTAKEGIQENTKRNINLKLLIKEFYLEKLKTGKASDWKLEVGK